MNQYTVIGVEHVYDSFDEYEHANPRSALKIHAPSLNEALDTGRKLLQASVTDERRQGGFLSSGMFLAEVTQVLDDAGHVVFPKIEAPGPILYEVPLPKIEFYREVSEELLARLAERPEERFGLHPRLFEEVVAELMSRMGFSVQLTPFAGDQGRDIIASIGTPLATMLMLVDCKRYALDRPVGVEAITRIWYRLFDDHANIGMIATTGLFQPVAKRAAEARGFQLTLKDGEDFIKWVRNLRKQ